MDLETQAKIIQEQQQKLYSINSTVIVLLGFIALLLIAVVYLSAIEKENRDRFRAVCEHGGGVMYRPAKSPPICIHDTAITELP